MIDPREIPKGMGSAEMLRLVLIELVDHGKIELGTYHSKLLIEAAKRLGAWR